MAARYNGKVCTKHPELDGLRDDHRRCLGCHREQQRARRKTPEGRAKHREAMRLARQRDPEKFLARGRADYQKHRHRARNVQLKVKFGLTLAEYEIMRHEQGDKCAICATDKAGGRGDWHVDHCHETDKIRGLLCHNCNVGLGNFKDNISFLQAAIKYLTNH